jgi:hypothetical protein
MASESRQTIGATRARQGRFGRHMIWVLLFGTILAAAGMFLAWTWKPAGFSNAEGSNGTPGAETTKTMSAPPPADATRQNYQEGGALAPKNGGNPQ